MLSIRLKNTVARFFSTWKHFKKRKWIFQLTVTFLVEIGDQEQQSTDEQKNALLVLMTNNMVHLYLNEYKWQKIQKYFIATLLCHFILKQWPAGVAFLSET